MEYHGWYRKEGTKEEKKGVFKVNYDTYFTRKKTDGWQT